MTISFETCTTPDAGHALPRTIASIQGKAALSSALPSLPRGSVKKLTAGATPAQGRSLGTGWPGSLGSDWSGCERV